MFRLEIGLDSETEDSRRLGVLIHFWHAEKGPLSSSLCQIHQR